MERGNRMSTAARALKAARDAMISIRVDGNRLILEAETEPPALVLKLLARHKAGVIDLLRPFTNGWSIDDWFVGFDELAGHAEFDDGLSRTEATARAFECCITEWLNRNPVRSPPGQCIGCGQTECSGDPVVPFGTDTTGHAWLHSRCWRDWHAARLTEARAALKQMGITPEGAKALCDGADDCPR